jgi:hypothetical protein
MEDEDTEWRRPAHVHAEHKAAVAKAEGAAAAVASSKAEIAALIAIDTDPPESPWLGHIEELYRDGMTILKEGIDEDQAASDGE